MVHARTPKKTEGLSVLDRAISIRLDALSTRTTSCVFLGSIVACFVMFLLANIFGGRLIARAEYEQPIAHPMSDPSTVWTQDLLLDTAHGDQYISLYMVVENKENSKRASVYPLTYGTQLNITSDGENTYYMSRVRSKEFSCARGEKWCDPQLIMRARSLDRESYVMGVRLMENDDVSWVGAVKFLVDYRNGSFIKFQCWANFIFFIFNIVVLSIYMVRLSGLESSMWNVEQFWLLLLLSCCLCYNDPFLVVSFVLNVNFLTLVSIYFKVAFYCMTFFFWFLVLEAIMKSGEWRPGKEGSVRSRWCKYLLLVNIWVSASIYFLWSNYQQRIDPFFELTDIHRMVLNKYWLAGCLVLYAVWLLILAVYAYGEFRGLSYNFKLLYMYLLVVIFATLGGLISEIAEKNDAAWQIVLPQAIHNFYLAVLAFMFAPQRIVYLASTQEDLDQEAREIMRDIYGEEEEVEEDEQLKKAWEAIAMNHDSSDDAADDEQQDDEDFEHLEAKANLF